MYELSQISVKWRLNKCRVQQTSQDFNYSKLKLLLTPLLSPTVLKMLLNKMKITVTLLQKGRKEKRKKKFVVKVIYFSNINAKKLSEIKNKNFKE